jgi:hypothetical protein
MSEAKSLVVGDSALTNIPVAILNLSILNLARNQAPVDGILGLPEMRRFGVVLDCAGQTLYLNPRGASRTVSTDLGRLLTAKGFARIPMRLNSRGDRLEINGAINGHDSRMIVETGAFLSCITKQTAASAGITYLQKVVTGGAAGGRRQQLKIGRAKELRIGSVKIVNADLAVGDLWGDCLGIEYLSLNGGVIDVGGLNLYLRQVGKP